MALPASDPALPAAEGAPRPPELTARALLFGCALGALLSAGNVYTGLKTSFIDGGSITAALLGFAFFATFRKLSPTPYSSLENNIAATAASSAGIMGFVVGFPGAIPALALLGHTYPAWQVGLWGVALTIIGVLVASALRRKLIITENLPFPTGAATAEVIETISSSRQTALRRSRFLMVSAVATMAFAWLRDGSPRVVPQSLPITVTVLGASLSTLTVGVCWSPLIAATGMLMGMRSAASMLLGATVSWVILAPWIAHAGIVKEASYGACSGWLIWPGVGLLLASSFVPLVMDWRSLVRAFRDIPALLRRAGRDGGAPLDTKDRFRLGLPLALVSVVVLLILGQVTFHLSPVITLIGVLLAAILGNVCARAAGETDLAPTGSVGTLTQLLFTGNGFVGSLVAGSIVSGVGSQASQTLWALKAGERLKARPSAQLWAQILGGVVGAVAAVPAYVVLVHAYGLGTESLPAPSALSWKATAEAVRGGFAAMPAHAPLAGVIAFVVGIVFAAGGRSRWGRFAPSPAAMGMAVLTPFSISATAFVGALLLAAVRRLRPNASEATLTAVAAGGIAGEAVMGVVVAALIATGVLKGS
jgi:putative OPT family oligopeptide transporter